MGKGSDLVRLWPIEKDCRTGDLTVAQGSSSSDVEADLDDDHDETAVTHAEQPSQGGTSAGVLSGPLWGMPVDQAVLPEDFFDVAKGLEDCPEGIVLVSASQAVSVIARAVTHSDAVQTVGIVGGQTSLLRRSAENAKECEGRYNQKFLNQNV